MMNRQYTEGKLVIAKLGSNPWWPGTVINCSKSNKCSIELDNNRHVFIKFLVINTETWIEVANVLNCSSKHEMELYLKQLYANSVNLRYLNQVPPAIVDVYSRAWILFDQLQQQGNVRRSDRSSEGTDNSTSTKCYGQLRDRLFGSGDLEPCEICMDNLIGFHSVDGANEELLRLAAGDRKERFATIMIDEAVEAGTRCGNFCRWRYHRRCAADENAFICSCNKSVWRCSICDQVISVSQLFVCNVHDCMRPYHRSCLSSHLELPPLHNDTRECPLHQCVNCSLDCLQGDGTEISGAQSASPLVHCVKCKIAFHDHPDCLPARYLPITAGLIVCYRHLANMAALRANVATFCFSCGGAVCGDNFVSCQYCPVTYHSTVDCLSPTTELIDDHSFVCYGCRFPFARRASYPLLVQPDDATAETGDSGGLGVHGWQLVLPVPRPVGADTAGDGRLTVTRSDAAGGSQQLTIDVARTIAVNLQSLDDLRCFGLLRFDDMQRAMRHLATTVARIADRLRMHQMFYRNAFVLKYAELFPVMENVSEQHSSTRRPSSPSADPADAAADSEEGEETQRCTCTDCCTSRQCRNAVRNSECTSANCADVLRCRNRRLQKRQHPRCRLVLVDGTAAAGGSVAMTTPTTTTTVNVVLEEAVVKDILVAELVGQLVTVTSPPGDSGATVGVPGQHRHNIDCSRYCNIARFIPHADRANLQPRRVAVGGTSRIGLFSVRRIGRGETLSIDRAGLAAVTTGLSAPLCLQSSSSSSSSTTVVTWVQQRQRLTEAAMETVRPDEGMTSVIDLCCDEEVVEAPGVKAVPTGKGDNGGSAPLCPVCLLELLADMRRPRVLVHCRGCFTVLHLHCAVTAADGTGCSPPSMEGSQFIDYMCRSCASLVFQ